jgi:drug/metabolite transporter superfamily protein YnfA
MNWITFLRRANKWMLLSAAILAVLGLWLNTIVSHTLDRVITAIDLFCAGGIFVLAILLPQVVWMQINMQTKLDELEQIMRRHPK